MKCGYNSCSSAMNFHHLDPKEKEMGLSSFRLWNWERALKELEKTILVCNRCHTEHHAGLWEPTEKMISEQRSLRSAYETREGLEPSLSVLQTESLA